MKRKLIFIGCTVVFLSLALSCSYDKKSGETVLATATAADVVDLNSFDTLKEAFQRDRGTVRLVSLLSPV